MWALQKGGRNTIYTRRKIRSYNTYYYIVESKREADGLRQRVLAYLGDKPTIKEALFSLKVQRSRIEADAEKLLADIAKLKNDMKYLASKEMRKKEKECIDLIHNRATKMKKSHEIARYISYLQELQAKGVTENCEEDEDEMNDEEGESEDEEDRGE